MLKKNKLQLIISSIVILLPLFAGLVLRETLPARMITHWGADGNAGVTALPLILLAVHWVCIFFTAKDSKSMEQNKRIFGIVLWICPVLSLFTSGIVYSAALGREFHTELLTLLFIGVTFIVLGNYLPKCRQNSTIGIKVKWTLANEDNWNATHRMSGKLWVIGGLFLIACIFLPEAAVPWALIIALPVMAVIPCIFSYAYHRKHHKNETVPKTLTQKKKTQIFALIFTAAILVPIGILLVTGDIYIEYGETSFTINADYWDSITVDYDDIDSIEYREYLDKGMRTFGFGSARLAMGRFKNSEFSRYTLYSYAGNNACVVLTIDGKILAVNGADEKSTAAIYDELAARLA